MNNVVTRVDDGLWSGDEEEELVSVVGDGKTVGLVWWLIFIMKVYYFSFSSLIIFEFKLFRLY